MDEQIFHSINEKGKNNLKRPQNSFSEYASHTLPQSQEKW